VFDQDFDGTVEEKQNDLKNKPFKVYSKYTVEPPIDNLL